MRALPFCLVLSSISALAQREPIFDQLGMKEGLPAEQILCLHQDQNGFVWIGTENGLARHEGSTIRTYHYDRSDPHSLPNEQVHDIAEDVQGRLWFATSGGVALYRPVQGDFQRHELSYPGAGHVPLNRVSDLLPEPGGSGVWLVTEAGIYLLRSADGGLEAAAPPMDDIQKGTMFRRSMIADTLRNGVWFGTQKGLRFFDRKSGSFFHVGNDPRKWKCFSTAATSCPALASDGSLWAFDNTTHQLFHSLPETGHLDTIATFNPGAYPYNPQFMAFTRDGRLWISTWNYQLLSFDPTTKQWAHHRHRENDRSSLVNGNVKALVEDRDGTLWFGTREGISLLVPRLQFMRVLPMATERPISAMHALANGAIAVGTRNGRLWIANTAEGADPLLRPLHEQALADTTPRNAVSCFGARRNGSPRIGRANAVAILDTGQYAVHADNALMDLVPVLRASSIGFMEEDLQGRTWIGTWNHGLFMVSADGLRAQHMGPDEARPFHLPANGMLSCLIARDGSVWIGMNDGGGLAHFTGDGPATLYSSSTDHTGLVNGVVTALAEAHDGTIWIGTHAGGIDRLDPVTGLFTHFSFKDGVPGVRVFGLAVDRADGLWASTIGGIAWLAQGAARFIELGLPNGMEEKELTEALCVASTGEVVFGVGKRLLVVDATRFATGDAPEVRIVSFTAEGRTIWDNAKATTLELRHDARGLAIQAGAIAFHDADRTRFAFRVGNLDTTWSDIGHSGRIDLNDLPTGTHRIELRASVDGSHWSDAPAEMRVTVLPPFWATWWFRGISAVLVVALVFVGFRVYLHDRLTKERERSRQEQAVLHERMRIAGDMHDDMGAGLSALKLRSEMALRMEKDPQKREQLGSLANTAGDLIGSMRQIIWTMNADQAGLEDLVVYTGSYVRTYCAENQLAVKVSASGPWPAIMLSTEQRRNIFLVVKEALHNVVKHAHATSVHLHMRPENGLTVELSDNGIGLPKGADLGAGNGLRNMKKRIVALGGTFDLRNGQGTELAFNVPLSASPNERSIAGVHQA
ncbi:MAG: two-component regulator propeller domain-containing protein [Flavobacteriales bacterium]